MFRGFKNLISKKVIYLTSSKRLSRFVGTIADLKPPKFVTKTAIRVYARAFKVDMNAFEEPEGGFVTFNDFFTRPLKQGIRSVARGSDIVVAPCDGKVITVGRIEKGMLLQAKGKCYSFASLLGDASLAGSLEGGQFITIYLSPSDYHRVHFPCDCQVSRLIYRPGRLFTVCPRAVEMIENLFPSNERLTTVMDTAFGTMVLCMIGASCVGRIRTSYTPISTETLRAESDLTFNPPISRKKGDELGTFLIGSTVVLAAGSSNLDLLSPSEGSPITMGIPVFRMR
jgi:phosphatidylserine decarboxylase